VAASDDRPPAVTIFEVAEAAGVSITTVSHVFSGKRPVGARTRRRVEEAAERLAYRPRPAARALASGRTMTLAVQFPLEGADVLLNAYFSGLVPAMSEPAVVRGYAFVLVPPDPARETFIEPLIDRRGIDGAVLLDPRAGDPFAEALLEAGIPFVSLGRTPDAPGTPRVDQDFAELMRVVAAHLAEQDYERPAFVNLPGEFSTLVDIEHAFLAAVPHGVAVSGAEPTDAAAAAAARELLDRPPARRPDAVVTMDARQAAAVYRAALELGLAVPGDVGVVALDDAMAASMDPPLTSVTLFPAEAGRALIELIDGVLGGAEPPPLTLVPFELRPRASTRRRTSD
jgi:DNA-binding LacI/PurR family transcriptional regulator